MMMMTSTTKTTSAVEIRLHCRKLWKRDLTSQSDAFCVLHRLSESSFNRTDRVPSKLPNDSRETEIGRTEVVKDSKDPDFTTSFEVDFHFEQEQTFALRVYDEDERGSKDLTKHDFLGETIFTLGQLMGSKSNSLARPLHRKKKGYVVLQAEEVSEGATSHSHLQLKLAGHNLKNTDGMFGLSDPFYQIKRINPDSTSWSVVYKSQVIKDNLNPTWDVETIPLGTLCNNDLKRKIQIQIMDWDSDGSHDDMGCVETTVQQLLNTKAPFDVMRESKSKLRPFGKKTEAVAKKKGTLSVVKADIVEIPTMLEYIMGGCEVSLTMAVDFTQSNGKPSNPNSLHYRAADGTKNEYQLAIEKIGSIVQEYDTNKQFPMFGFGAEIDGVYKPCFRMGQAEEVCGVHGMLKAYEQTFETPGFGLYGPTNFSPVINEAMKSAREAAAHGNQCYSVLVILTDGAITDFDETLRMIATAIYEPMSIVIIGVGSADFSSMEYLDGDDRNRKGKSRDIVQFVPFRKYARNVDLLANETLREIPGQLVHYYLSRGIRPNPPIPAHEFTEEEIFVSWGDDDDEEEIDLS